LTNNMTTNRKTHHPNYSHILMVLEMTVLEVMGHPDIDSYIIVLRHELSASLIVRFLSIPLNTLLPNLDTSILQRLRGRNNALEIVLYYLL